MGIFDKPTPEFLRSIQDEHHFSPPAEHGFDVVDGIKAMHGDQVKVFIGMGGNFLSATPDTEFTAAALRRCLLTVQISTKPNRGHFVHGRRALILPTLGRTEIDERTEGAQFVTVEDSMSVVHMSVGHLNPGVEQEKMSEVGIVCGLAQAVFAANPFKKDIVEWRKLADNYDHIRDHIARAIPGFEGFNDRVREPGGFYLPHPVRDTQSFHTKTMKGRFFAAPLIKTEMPEDALVLMTIRSHDQFNTTIYGLHDRYRGINEGRRVILMNHEDILERGLKDRDWVDVTSHYRAARGAETRTAPRFMIVKYEIPRKTAAAYYPEANVLVPIDSVIPESNTPTFKSILITVAPSVIEPETIAAR